MSNVNAVTNVEPSRSAIQYFQTTYPALISAFNQAMGEVSQGVSNIDPLGGQKTATEVRNTQRQQQVRDQKNQVDLGESLSDMMSMWLSNNQQFLLSDKKKDKYILRIVGKQQYEYFKRAGLDQMELTDEAMSEIAGVITNQGGNISQQDIDQLIEAGKTPRFPVEEKEGYSRKMVVNDIGDGAEITLVPEDLDGYFDYVPDTQSMALGSGEQQLAGKQKALELLMNPGTQGMLQQAGVTIKMKDLLVDYLEDIGANDAEKFFDETVQQSLGAQQGVGVPQGASQLGAGGGMPNGIDPSLAGQAPQPMAGPEGMQIPQGL
jgi:hypothetical protein